MNRSTRSKIKILLVSMMFISIIGFGIYKGNITSIAYTQQNGTVTGNNVNVRKDAGTGSASIDSVMSGQAVTVIGEKTHTDNYIWYNITYTKSGVTTTGWIRSDFLAITPGAVDSSSDPAFEALLEAEKFPESYRTYLRALHAKYPNWQFKALHTNLEWTNVLAGQLDVVYRNLVPKSSPDSWKSLEAGAYNWDTGVWYEYESGWVAASTEILQYFMDPRNSLSDSTSILQFQSLRWTGLENTTGVSNIIKGTFMGNSTTYPYSQYFIDAGALNNISAYHLSTRAVQEVSTSGGGYSGSVAGPYYNFFNIGATGSNPVAAAVAYATTQGWDSPYKSITGGSVFIGQNYINRGQDTLYLQKFDVVDGGDGYFWHQYMTNVQAPTSEAKNLLKAYNDLASSAISFTIPVYLNMPSTASTKPTSTGSPNNLLKALSINGYSLTPVFNKFTTEYSLVVPNEVTSITVAATPIVSTSSVKGTGTVNLNVGNNAVNIVCTAGNGTTKTYTINVARAGGTSEEIKVSDTASITTTYRVSDTISGVAVGTTVDTLKANITTKNCTVSVHNTDGTDKMGVVGTGTIVRIKEGNTVVKEYKVVVYGDINGDGKISILDLSLVQRHILQLSTLSDVYAKAADASQGNDGISILDLSYIQRHILGIAQIRQ